MVAEGTCFLFDQGRIVVTLVDHQPVAVDLAAAFRDLDVSLPAEGRSDAELPVDSPEGGVVFVGRVIDDGDPTHFSGVRDLHSEIYPLCRFSFAGLVLQALAVDATGRDSPFPGHAQEEAPVSIPSNRDVDPGRALPLKIEGIVGLVINEAPALLILKDDLAPGTQKIADAADGGGMVLSGHDLMGYLRVGPELLIVVVEVVASVDAGGSPVETGLVPVMARRKLGQDRLAIRAAERMEVGASVGVRVQEAGEGGLAGASHEVKTSIPGLQDFNWVVRRGAGDSEEEKGKDRSSLHCEEVLRSPGRQWPFLFRGDKLFPPAWMNIACLPVSGKDDDRPQLDIPAGVEIKIHLQS